MSGATVFIGFMGSGKSTAARQLATRLGVEAVDSDTELERRLGRSIAAEFQAGGEPAFRAREEEVVLELLARADQRSVLSLGGGSVLSPRVAQALARHLVVLMEVDPGHAWARVDDRPGLERPLARDREAFFALYGARESLYEQLADAVLPSLTPEVAVRALPGLQALRHAPPGTRMVWASAASGEYPVLLGAGLIAGSPAGRSAGGGAGEAPAWWPLPRQRSRAFCVTDANVAPLYGEALRPVETLIAIEPGEPHKTLASAELVWSELLRAGMTRADHLVALGGGVVGDLGGFCAATYQRGVPVVQVPTTLVAQVDSAYGGKTGVDLPAGKNYVGAYHQPAAVIVDPATLATLPQRELAAGWVEVLKTAMIAGGALWRRVAGGAVALNGGPAADPAGAATADRRGAATADGQRAAPAGTSLAVDADTIFACARTKLAVVAADERDAGARQALNLGHTIGHAIEVAAGYGRYLHGEAVGLGLLGALRLAGASELRGEVEGMLAARGLPTRLGGAAAAADIVAAAWHDKKRLGQGAVPFVLPRAPGDLEIGVQVPERELVAAVAELCR